MSLPRLIASLVAGGSRPSLSRHHPSSPSPPFHHHGKGLFTTPTPAPWALFPGLLGVRPTSLRPRLSWMCRVRVSNRCPFLSFPLCARLLFFPGRRGPLPQRTFRTPLPSEGCSSSTIFFRHLQDLPPPSLLRYLLARSPPYPFGSAGRISSFESDCDGQDRVPL